jgi:hypothetical protein
MQQVDTCPTSDLHKLSVSASECHIFRSKFHMDRPATNPRVCSETPVTALMGHGQASLVKRTEFLFTVYI